MLFGSRDPDARTGLGHRVVTVAEAAAQGRSSSTPRRAPTPRHCSRRWPGRWRARCCWTSRWA
ncbi:hypothetical protein ACFQ60_25315 [Streptomyces zhihengii]